MRTKPGTPLEQYKRNYLKDASVEKRIYYILINTKDHMIAKRDIRMRLRRLDYFESVYTHLLDEGAISEWGSGKKGDPVVVRLDKPDYLK